MTFGNHDNEQDKTRAELYDVVRSVPYNIQPDRGEADSPDYVLALQASDSNRDAALLYCMDSHSYSRLPDVKGYAWFTFDQVNWYRSQSAAYTERNGGKPLPALAFFPYFPLPEYNQAAADESAILIGTRMEKACAPLLNTGMFAAMKEAGDVMGTFVGHDHDNDYSVMWHGILLAYGRFTGGNTEYNHLPNGARVILMKENARTFTTWIRIKGGEIVDKRFIRTATGKTIGVSVRRLERSNQGASYFCSVYYYIVQRQVHHILHLYRFGSFLHVDVPQGDVVQFGFRQSVSHERYAVYAVTGYIFNADVAE